MPTVESQEEAALRAQQQYMSQLARIRYAQAQSSQSPTQSIAATFTKSVWKKWKWEIIGAAAPWVFSVLLWAFVVLVVVILLALVYKALSECISDPWGCFQQWGLKELKDFFDITRAFLTS